MFLDEDQIESAMGVRVEYMSPVQLQDYVRRCHAADGLTVVPGRYASDRVFLDLHATYGKRAAGRIVKWAFAPEGPYRGRFRDHPITHSDFARGSKWWTDKLHLEMQEQIAREKTASARAAAPAGARRLDF